MTSQSARKHYFTDVDYHVITLLLPTGEYGAYRAVEDEPGAAGRVCGFGHTRLAAIADLKEQLEDQANDGE